MPVKRLEYTFNYIRPNIPSFILVLILIFCLDILNRPYGFTGINYIIIAAIIFTLTAIFHGYGLNITKNVINNGKSLPKLEFYKSFILGVKSMIIVLVYTTIQLTIFGIVADLFEFPFITIEEGTIHMENVGTLFYAHGSLETILYVIFIIGMIYISTFFLEIALARLADKGSVLSALNFVSIKKCIDTIGWNHFISDYTKLIIAIAILAYIKYGADMMVIDNLIFDLFIGLLIFIIEYIGIGAIYRDYKYKKYGGIYKRPRRRTSYQK